MASEAGSRERHLHGYEDWTPSLDGNANGRAAGPR